MGKKIFAIAGMLLLLCTGCGQKDEFTVSESVEEEVPSGETQTETVIRQAAEQMTLEEQVGQLFWVRCPTGQGAEAAKAYQFGGYVLFAQDFKDQTPESVRETLTSYQEQVKIPMLIGVDEEGGTVNRVSRYSAFRESPFDSPRQVYSQGGWDKVREDTAEKCQLLKSLGITVNLAPVCDLCGDPDDFLYARSFSDDEEETAEYVRLVVETMEDNQVEPVLKHFPGYGDNGDTHTEIIVDKRPKTVYEESDFLPFQAGIAAGADCVLVSHNIVESMDSQRPASMSPAVHQLLRQELGFEGVIMTDDLSMAAITQYCDGREAAVQAVLAGNDLICCSDYETQIPAVIQAVEEGVISREQLLESVERILGWKMEMGLWTPENT